MTAATKDALRGGPLDKAELHEALRSRVSKELLPWCRGCKSHHVAPMLWRYASVKAGARLDASRRYVLGKPGRTPRAPEAVRRFLGYYGPAKPGDFADWAGLETADARKLWAEVEGDLEEIDGAWLLRAGRRARSSRRRMRRACASSLPAIRTSRSPTAASSPPTATSTSASSARSPARGSS